MRYLTKSRFKTALECPNKLYYTKKQEYANQKEFDPFLEALASGGFQVEELASFLQYVLSKSQSLNIDEITLNNKYSLI
jgi:hypothetical protein